MKHGVLVMKAVTLGEVSNRYGETADRQAG